MTISFDARANTLNGKPLSAAVLMEVGLTRVFSDFAHAHPTWIDEFRMNLSGHETEAEMAEMFNTFLQEKGDVYRKRLSSQAADGKTAR